VSSLDRFRRRLDVLDEELGRLLGARFDIVREVASHKRENGIPIMQPDRVVEVRTGYLARGAELGIPPDFTASLFDLLIAASCKLEDELIDAPQQED
jgi:chorismate mutase